MGHFGEALTDIAGRTFRILLYHSISEARDYEFSVAPQEFAWQMEWLHRQGVRVQSLEEVLGQDSFKTPARGPRVVISFDDGYEDNFTTALPVMEKYGFKATFFIATGFVGQTNSWETDPDIPTLKMMDWEQIKVLVDKGHIIGGHTHGHINLKTTDVARRRRDMLECRRILDEKIKSGFVPFAYPFGQCDEGATELVKELGYNCALVVGGFWGNSQNTSRWRLKREDVFRDRSRRDFKALVRGALDPTYYKLGLYELTASAGSC